MKIYKLTINEIYQPTSLTSISGAMLGNRTVAPILVDYYMTKAAADQRKNETLAGIKALLGVGAHNKYEIDIQEIDVKE